MAREIVANSFLTLDGVMQAPGGPDEDPSGGFRHGGWSAPYWDEEMGRRMESFMDQPFDLLLGRRTYEIFAAHWPYADEAARAERGGQASPVDNPAANALNRARKYVASRTLTEVTWNNSVLLEGDVTDAVTRLKQLDGPPIQVHGSANLLQTLIAADLVDRFDLWIFPVVVGGGKRLFESGTVPRSLTLVDQAVSATGVVTASYRRGGAVPHGSFAFEQPSPAELERRRKLARE